MQSNSKRFTFDGGALTYLGTGILALVSEIDETSIYNYKVNQTN
jgi:hypothetical protein